MHRSFPRAPDVSFVLRVMCALAASGAARAVEAAVPHDRFPFPLPWDDATAGTATDLSHLNQRPAGINGRIVVRNGTFVEAITGRRVRFLGINMGGDVAFPVKEDADRIAAHLAKAGINVIRFHNLDGKNPPKTLIDYTFNDTQHLNEEHLDRFFYLIAKLKEHGIYSNINLRVMRALSPGDGVPKWEGEEPYPLKMANRFPPRWVELQKKWAHDLLTRRNPHTGLSLAEDPCVLCVEVDNENSILEYGPRFSQMPPYYCEELRKLWNKWLLEHYMTDAGIRRVWKPAPKNTPSAIRPDQQWNVEQHQGPGARARIVERTANGDAPDVTIEVEHGGGMDWHVQAQLLGLNLEDDEDYTLSFRIRSDLQHHARLAVQRDINDWRNNGLSADYASGPEWRTYAFSFLARDTMKDHTRVAIFIGGSSRPNTFQIADIRLVKGNPKAGLQPGESLEKQNIPLPDAGGKEQLRDGYQFLVDLDREFSETMRAYVKNDLKVKALVIDSQVHYGGITGYNREANMDYADAHGYWEHPEFRGRAWDFSLGNWFVGNTPQSAALATGKGSEVQKLAMRRAAGKPYSVSEYDCPFPGEYVSEMYPLVAVVSCLQDWDAVYTFCGGPYGRYGPSDLIAHAFDNLNHPGKFGYFPAAALAFRQRAFEPLKAAKTLKLPEKAWMAGYFRVENVWRGILGGEPDILRYRYGVAPTYLPEGARPEIEDTPGADIAAQTVEVEAKGGRHLLTAAAPTCAVLCGEFGGTTSEAGPMKLTFKPFTNNFGAAVLNSVDGKPIGESSRLLLTIGARFENMNMNWNRDHNGLGKSPGDPPVVGVRMDGRIEIKTNGARNVYVLDAAGRRRKEVSAEWNNGTLFFPVRPDDETMYYEIAFR